MLLAQISDGQKFRHQTWDEGDVATMVVNDASQQDDVIVGSVSFMRDNETTTIAQGDSDSMWLDDRYEVVE